MLLFTTYSRLITNSDEYIFTRKDLSTWNQNLLVNISRHVLNAPENVLMTWNLKKNEKQTRDHLTRLTLNFSVDKIEITRRPKWESKRPFFNDPFFSTVASGALHRNSRRMLLFRFTFAAVFSINKNIIKTFF